MGGKFLWGYPKQNAIVVRNGYPVYDCNPRLGYLQIGAYTRVEFSNFDITTSGLPVGANCYFNPDASSHYSYVYASFSADEGTKVSSYYGGGDAFLWDRRLICGSPYEGQYKVDGDLSSGSMEASVALDASIKVLPIVGSYTFSVGFQDYSTFVFTNEYSEICEPYSFTYDTSGETYVFMSYTGPGTASITGSSDVSIELEDGGSEEVISTTSKKDQNINLKFTCSVTL